MGKPEIIMRTVSEIDEVLLNIGVPFKQGVLHDGSLLRLSCDGKLLPLWWEKRAI